MAAAEPICESPTRKVPVIWQDHTCEGCGCTFKPKRAENNHFCSRECWYRVAAQKKLHTAKRRLEDKAPYSRVWCAPCVCCGQPMVSRAKRLYCSYICGAAYQAGKGRTSKRCKHCGAEFKPIYGHWHTGYCSRSCRRKALKGDWSKTHRHRARHYGVAYEPIDRVKLFERDGWKCQICGGPTPRRLMGTTHPRAPELEHRIPLSRGGTHTWSNAQCAHRQCNIDKGCEIRGQMPLFSLPCRGRSKV